MHKPREETLTPKIHKEGGRRNLAALEGGGGGVVRSVSGRRSGKREGPLYRSYVSNIDSGEQDAQSFELNQSYPKFHSSHQRALYKFDANTERPHRAQLTARNKALHDFTGLELNSVNFSRFAPPFAESRAGVRQIESCASIYSSPKFASELSSLMGRRASDEVCQYKRRGSLLTSPMAPGSPDPSTASATPFFPPSDPTFLGKNPNKAVLTIDGRTKKILIANDMACSLLSMEQSEVVGRSLESLCRDVEEVEESTSKSGKGFLHINFASLFTSHGQLLPINGKIVELLSSSGSTISVSLWIYPLKVQEERKKLSSPTPPLRLSDSMPASILRTARFSDTSESTSKTSNASQPFLLLMEPIEVIKGSAVLGPKGRIFSTAGQISTIFGCKCSTDCLGLKVQDLVPHLDCSETCSPAPSTSSAPDSSEKSSATQLHYLTGTKLGIDGDPFPVKVVMDPTTDEDGYVLKYDVNFRVLLSISGVVTVFPDGKLHSFNSNFVRSLLGYTDNELRNKPISTILPDFLDSPVDGLAEENFENPLSSDYMVAEMEGLELTEGDRGISSPQLCSTPVGPARIREGNFVGHCEHKDGARLPVIYQVRRLVLKGGEILYCVWIAWEGDFTEPTDGSEETNVPESPSVEITSRSDINYTRNSSLSEGEWSEMTAGKYEADYDTLQQIGKGAFGAVKIAARKSDGLLVVTKFMRISKMLADSWILSRETGKKLPIEVHLLQAISHPNIVKVLQVYANDSFYQMVMEKHGCGMDLFDFIDRQPNIDEPLISFIFRQIVAAVSYLHGLHIVHRDLKDENVIIDQHFNCKIIDFGSAAYYSPDKLFSTFCGTMEYCSPEVLLGNKYNGPELEMWSLGILLYTLVFFENPFASPEETIEGFYELPFDVSEGLTNLLGSLLYPDPIQRATVQESEKHWWVTQKVDPSDYQFSHVLPNCEPHEIDPPVFKSGLSTEH